MASTRPVWRRTVDGVEQRLADPLEHLVRHDAVGITLTVAARGFKGARRIAEHNSRRVLHALNIPAASDINRLLDHIAHVERELRALSASTSGRGPIREARRPRTPAIGPGTAE